MKKSIFFCIVLFLVFSANFAFSEQEIPYKGESVTNLFFDIFDGEKFFVGREVIYKNVQELPVSFDFFTFQDYKEAFKKGNKTDIYCFAKPIFLGKEKCCRNFPLDSNRVELVKESASPMFSFRTIYQLFLFVCLFFLFRVAGKHWSKEEKGRSAFFIFLIDLFALMIGFFVIGKNLSEFANNFSSFSVLSLDDFISPIVMILLAMVLCVNMGVQLYSLMRYWYFFAIFPLLLLAYDFFMLGSNFARHRMDLSDVMFCFFFYCLPFILYVLFRAKSNNFQEAKKTTKLFFDSKKKKEDAQ